MQNLGLCFINFFGRKVLIQTTLQSYFHKKLHDFRWFQFKHEVFGFINILKCGGMLVCYIILEYSAYYNVFSGHFGVLCGLKL